MQSIDALLPHIDYYLNNLKISKRSIKIQIFIEARIFKKDHKHTVKKRDENSQRHFIPIYRGNYFHKMQSRLICNPKAILAAARIGFDNPDVKNSIKPLLCATFLSFKNSRSYLNLKRNIEYAKVNCE